MESFNHRDGVVALVELVAEDACLLYLEGLGAELVKIVIGDEHLVINLLHVLELESTIFNRLLFFLKQSLLPHQLVLQFFYCNISVIGFAAVLNCF